MNHLSCSEAAYRIITSEFSLESTIVRDMSRGEEVFSRAFVTDGNSRSGDIGEDRVRKLRLTLPVSAANWWR